MRPESTTPRRGRRILGWTLASVLLVSLGLSGVAVWQNSFDLDETRVSISQGEHTLHGVLARPRDGRDRHGLVVVIHGDGPVDATHSDGYRPLWEAYAQAGFATLSWDKPGVAGAPGNWLEQSMDDRAGEAVAAIAWARSRQDIDPGRIGLWGASQAGWVLPKIAKRTPVSFAIAVSPAVNWLQQGRYHLLAELRAQGASAEQIAQRTARSDTTRRLLERRATFQEYVREIGDPEDMTAPRWGFILRNYTADATADLPALQGIPVLLALGGQDRNVDVADTESGYRTQLSSAGRLTVRHYPDAAHSMVKQSIEQSEVKSTLTALFAPRSLFADAFLADQQQLLRQL